MDKFPDFLEDSTDIVAKRLLGCEFVRRFSDGQQARVKIVETEAYDQTDAASHSYKGESERTKVMFGVAGFLYVYFTYGMHYCCNVVTGRLGHGSAVLVRAVEPVKGVSLLRQNRPLATGVTITNGPAKLCQALGIAKQLNGHNLRSGELRLVERAHIGDANIVTATRIGISAAKEMPWRFYIKNNPYVSKR